MQRNPHSYQIATGYRTFYSLSLIYQPITKKRLFLNEKGLSAGFPRAGRLAKTKTDNIYWSSSEFYNNPANNALYVNVNNGNVNNNNKNNRNSYVRPVLAFSIKTLR